MNTMTKKIKPKTRKIERTTILLNIFEKQILEQFCNDQKISKSELIRMLLFDFIKKNPITDPRYVNIRGGFENG